MDKTRGAIFVLFALFCGSCNANIEDLLKKLACPVPRDANDITRAMLLQQCVSDSKGWGNETECYDELGCFPMTYPWVSLLRPVPQPMKPDHINTRFYLYTRKDPELRHYVKSWPKIELEESDYDPSRPYNVFITHGFSCDGNFSFQAELTKAYLNRRDANVFVTDWGDGAKIINYGMAASNTRIVAAEITRLIQHLMDKYNVSGDSVHLIGHSLGAQISGYVGKNLDGNIGRITGLDPAQPLFEGLDARVRLTKTDAFFVEAIHTSARPFAMLGFGVIKPVGNVDIYANGGGYQPDCPVNFHIDNVNFNISDIKDIVKIPVDTLTNWVGCSHLRSIDYFVESVQEESCLFWCRRVPLFGMGIQTGKIFDIAKVVAPKKECTIDTCVPLGLDLPDYPGAAGVFALSTSGKSRYCLNDESTNQRMAKEMTEYGVSTQAPPPKLPILPTLPKLPSVPSLPKFPSLG